MHTGSEVAGFTSPEQWARTRLAVEGLAPGIRDALTALADTLAAQRELLYEYFLTVVIRTQAKRWEQIQDALLCLNAQTDQDFEVVVMMHDVGEDKATKLCALVESYPIDFSSRVRLIRVDGGNRTRPLNDSLAHVRGRYVVFFDDDDLLMANWVESFRAGADRAPGKVVRANVAVQLNRTEEQTDGTVGQRSIGPAHSPYASKFQFIDHIERSYSPFMGIAYPIEFFAQWGERFDETLPVCEDWDILLRAVALVGVTSVPELTAIYRLWDNAQTSYTGHSESVWDEAKAQLQDRLDSSPYFMPEGSLRSMLDLANFEAPDQLRIIQALKQSEDVRLAMEASTSWRITAPLRHLIGGIRSKRND